MLPPLKVIFVGKPGSGKTIGYADFSRPMIVVDTDSKLRTLKYFFKDKIKLKRLYSYDAPIEDYGYNLKDDVLKCGGFDANDMESIQYLTASSQDFPTLDSNLRAIIANPPISKNGTPGTWVMDSLTTIADNTIKYALSQGGHSKNTGVIPIPDLPEWLTESMFLSSLFTDAKDLPCNVVLTAHITITERDVMATKAERASGMPMSTVKKVTKQLMTGGTKIGAKIPAYFSEVWNFQVAPPIDVGQYPSYSVFTKSTEEFPQARTELPLPYEIPVTYDPTQPTLWNHVQRALTEVMETTT